MAKKIVLVTTIVDHSISEYFKDMEIILYDELIELVKFVETTPIRCDKLVITEDTTATGTTSAFGEIINLMRKDNYFFDAKELVFVSPPGSNSLAILDYILQATDSPLEKPIIVQGTLTREFLVSAIKGTYRETGKQTRMSVERKRRTDFNREEIEKRAKIARGEEDLDDETVQSDDDLLATLPPQDYNQYEEGKVTKTAKTIQIVGSAGRGKTSFLLLLAQFISRKHKVVIIDNDLDYFSLSAYIEYGGIECTKIDVADVYNDPIKAAAVVANSQHNLVAIVGKSSYRFRKYSSAFLIRMCFSLFSTSTEYMILESDTKNMLPATRSIMVLRNDLISILKDIQTVPFQTYELDFVALSTQTIGDGQIVSSEELTKCVSEMLNIVIEQPIPIYQLLSYKIGGSIYDLHRYM